MVAAVAGSLDIAWVWTPNASPRCVRSGQSGLPGKISGFARSDATRSPLAAGSVADLVWSGPTDCTTHRQNSGAGNEKSPLHAESCVSWLAHTASACLIDEARLSSKPGLVDSRGNGAHQDLNLALMERSARSLQPNFHALAEQSWRRPADIALRETVGRLGREGEAQMMLATGGVNTHRGGYPGARPAGSARWRCWVERVSHRRSPTPPPPSPACPTASRRSFSKGLRASRRWQVPGAREEAQCGFPASPARRCRNCGSRARGAM